jgi:hypothetical protein
LRPGARRSHAVMSSSSGMPMILWWAFNAEPTPSGS